MTTLRVEDPSWASWKFWQSALKGRVEKVPLGIVARGFYAKLNRSTGIWYPAAIWIEDEGTAGAHKVAQVGMGQKQMLDTAEAEEDFDTKTFSWIQKTPITYEDYQHWMANREWPDGHALLPKTAQPARVAVPGDNSLHADPDAQASSEYTDQVEAALARLADFDTVATQETADGAQDLRNRLTALAVEGEGKHKAAKEPWLEGGRKVDGQWKPIIAKARAGAGTLRNAIGKWGAAESAKRAEEAKAAAVEGDATTAIPEAVTVGTSAIGRISRIRNTTEPNIIDRQKVLNEFSKNTDMVALLEKHEKEVNALLIKLVKKVHAAGVEIKGVEYVAKSTAT